MIEKPYGGIGLDASKRTRERLALETNNTT